MEWTPIKLGILKREYEKAVERGDEQFTLPDSVKTADGGKVQLLTRYAKYLIEYLEDVIGMKPM